MKPYRCVFLGYLWPMANAIIHSPKVELVSAGIECHRSKSKEAIDFFQKSGVDWFDAKTIRSNEKLGQLLAEGIDLIVVGAFGQILDLKILKAPRYGVLNVHPSLLPAYRGGSPIEEQILRGESRGGVTLHWMSERVDEGSIVACDSVDIFPDDDYETVLGRCVKAAELKLEELLKSPIDEWPKKEIPSDAPIYSPRKRHDGIVNWNGDASGVRRLCLALGWRDWVRAELGSGDLIIRKVRISNEDACGKPGEVLSVNPCISVACRKGVVDLIDAVSPIDIQVGTILPSDAREQVKSTSLL